MGQIKFTVSLVMTALFVVGIIGMALSFGNNNEVAISLGDDPEFMAAQTNAIGNITALKTASDEVSESYFTSQAEAGDEVSQSGTQFKAGIPELVGISKNTFKLAYVKIFGQDEGFGIFLTALLSVLLMIGAAYFYKLWFGKNPD